MVSFMNLQAKYLPNKGKHSFSTKKKQANKKTQCNHSALSNCDDIIM